MPHFDITGTRLDDATVEVGWAPFWDSTCHPVWLSDASGDTTASPVGVMLLTTRDLETFKARTFNQDRGRTICAFVRSAVRGRRNLQQSWLASNSAMTRDTSSRNSDKVKERTHTKRTICDRMRIAVSGCGSLNQWWPSRGRAKTNGFSVPVDEKVIWKEIAWSVTECDKGDLEGSQHSQHSYRDAWSGKAKF